MSWLLIIWTLSFQNHYVFVVSDENTCNELGMEMVRLSIHEPVPPEYHCMEVKK